MLSVWLIEIQNDETQFLFCFVFFSFIVLCCMCNWCYGCSSPSVVFAKCWGFGRSPTHVQWYSISQYLIFSECYHPLINCPEALFLPGGSIYYVNFSIKPVQMSLLSCRLSTLAHQWQGKTYGGKHRAPHSPLRESQCPVSIPPCQSKVQSLNTATMWPLQASEIPYTALVTGTECGKLHWLTKGSLH